MKRFIVALGTVLMGVLPAVAHAQSPTRQHLVVYEHAYQRAKHTLGLAVVGCHLGTTCHEHITDVKIIHSTQILHRMLGAISRPNTTVAVLTPSTAGPVPVTSAAASMSTTSPAIAQSTSGSGLEKCIISRESGGDAEAENGQYGGIGQWSSTSWAQDGGTRYAASPTQASYAEQAQVLQDEGSAGMASQQGDFDGC